MDKEDVKGRGQVGMQNGRVVMNTPDRREQKMASECPHCGFHSQRVQHPYTGDTICPACFEETEPAYFCA